ncbi:MAG: hypothetical protein IPG17_26770 [Sandaracinaceae bacterium]|jgi:hypothetical protein|nr:hypothetical protein [Sandaracinaceae bacterium]MBP7684966.1 hypothetical protein [Deltaproteobacteria bacterium]MBK6808119.1 hypothetical protein [Sandaracinaceae bacterium]MBK7151025.1 hypothetical protein [Sandaracinaceae bacterium]MBK7773144.1 hypothetical protein [Sandaracinaceae bacterium]
MTRTSMRLVYLFGVVVSASALGAGATAVASATAVMSAPRVAAPEELVLVADPAPLQSEPETPFEEAEQTSDPTESSKGGEERPESSDGETPFLDGRYIATLASADALTARVGSPPPVSEAALASQFHPDGLDRPPRA